MLSKLKRIGWTTALVLGTAARIASADEPAYTIKPGDVLSVAVWKEPDLQDKAVLVRPDGTFSFPLAGEIDARGKTVTDLQKTLTERIKKYINDPVVSLSVAEIKGNKVYVIGQVNKPGDFVINPRVNVMQALSMAGGTTAFAALNDITILRRSAPSGQVALPFHYADVVRGKRLQENIDLESGDIIVVP